MTPVDRPTARNRRLGWWLLVLALAMTMVAYFARRVLYHVVFQ